MARSKNSGWIWVASLLAIFLVVGLLIAAGERAVVGIVESQEASSRKAISSGEALPSDATNITDVGNGWYEFNYKNKRFLYHSSEVGYGAQECIVQIAGQ